MARDEMACSASLIITAWILNELQRRSLSPSPQSFASKTDIFLLWVEQGLVAWKLETKMKEN